MYKQKKKSKIISKFPVLTLISYLSLIIICISILLPFLHELAKSLSHPFEVDAGKVGLFPRNFVDEELFFDINADYQDSLDNKVMTGDIIRLFADNSIVLSENLSVRIAIEGKQWTVSDNDNDIQYTIKKEENKLNIYSAKRSEIGITLGSYYYYIRRQLKPLSRALLNTFFLVFVGGTLSVGSIVLLAFPLSRPRREFRLGSLIIYMIVFCIIFQRPLIPLRISFQMYGLLNSLWAIVLNMLINPFLVILAITYFKSLPDELFDAARIDGANELTTFVRIILPICKSIIVTIFLMQAVAYWNSFLQARLLLTDSNLYPIQNFVSTIMRKGGDITDVDFLKDPFANSESIKSALTIITTIPITVIYIMLQKYFTRGLTVGAVKG